MPDQIAFIDREDELEKIKALIHDWGTSRVLCLHGEGGVGKTRLLEEVQTRYRGSTDTPLLVSDIIDFDDRTLHVIENVERRIMQNLGAEAFEIYSRKLLDWHKIKQARVSTEELDEQRKQVRQTLVNNFNRMSAKHRIILLLDTLEKLEATDAWSRLTNLVLQARNALFILSGREAKKLYERLCREFSEIAEISDLIELQPLTLASGQQYLAEKQRQLSITLDPTLAENLLSLTGGKPILIDLAAEWLSRDIPLDWMTSHVLPIQTLTGSKKEQLQKDFEVQLVAHIGQIRTQMDRLVLLMSRVYPLNPDMIAKALNIDDDAAEMLLKQAKTYVFVKSAPGGQIYLHDEMRRMIREYVWPDIDSEGDRRQLDSQFAVEYLKFQSQILGQKIEQLAAKEKQALQEQKMEVEFETFLERQGLEQALWAVREQLLYHTLFITVNEGVKLFIEIFDQATQEYQYSFREVLLEQMRRYIDRAKQEEYLKPLSFEQIYEVDIRRAKFLLDSGQYDHAENELRSLLSRNNLQPGQRIDTRIQIANVALRLGRLHESIGFFAEAVDISRANNLQNWLVKAENGLGWAYRNVANREEARKHYEAALNIARKLNLKHDQALLYNNLGFIYTYIPSEREKASSYCKASLKLSEELKDRRGIGRAYSALGCATFMNGQFDEALTYFQRALNIFEPANDREWLSTVYSWRGSVYLSTNDLDLAERDLLQSLEMNIKKDRPMNLSRLGLIYIMQGKLDEAQEVVDECRALAMDFRDVLYQLISIRDLARLACHKKDYSQLETLNGYLQQYLQEWGQPQDRRAFGMLYLNFGSLALGQSKFDAAIDYYKMGLEPLAELGRYGNDTLEVHVRRLDRLFVTEMNLDSEEISRIGRALQSFWLEKGFDNTYPEVLIQFEMWAMWKEA